MTADLYSRASLVLAFAIDAIDQALEILQPEQVILMSFSFSVPAGPASEFADRAAKAKADTEAASENNDYALTQVSSATADVAIKAAVTLADELSGSLTEGDAALAGTVTATISGHHSTDGVTASNVSVGVSFTPAPAASTKTA